MTWEEVGREIAFDFKESDIAARGCKRVVANGNKYRRAYGNRTGLHIFTPFSIKTKRNNTFFILPIADNKKSLKLQGPTISIFIFFRLKVGACFAVVSPSNNIEIYHSHLIDRHKQRFSNEEQYQSDEFRNYAMEFVVHNFNGTIAKQPNSKYGEDAVYERCSEGTLLGHRLSQNLYVFKTYLNDEQLRGEQIEISDRLEDKRALVQKEYNETLHDSKLKDNYKLLKELYKK